MLKLRRIAIFSALILSALLGVWYFINSKLEYHTPETMLATTFKPGAPLKNFKLFDTNGKVFNEKSLRGHWTLVFFGYMGCPDTCPQTLGIVRDTWNLYQTPDHPPARFLFVNINPITFPNEDLKSFLANYNPDFIGIGGSATAVAQFSDQLGIYSKQVDNKIDHTASLMLIDPHARLRAVFTPPFIADEIAKDLDLLTIL